MLWHMPDDASDIRHAKLFQNGRSQAVRIPRDMQMPGSEVTLRKVGDAILIEPVHRKTGLIEYLTNAEPIEDDFDFGEDLPAEPVDL